MHCNSFLQGCSPIPSPFLLIDGRESGTVQFGPVGGQNGGGLLAINQGHRPRSMDFMYKCGERHNIDYRYLYRYL